MRIAIDAITIGERRREDLGDLAGLAESIRTYGLLHLPVIDDAGNLVAGARRIRACMLLGWTDIDVRSLGELTEIERREIELEENLQRKDLTAYERAKTVVVLAETVREVAKEEAERVYPMGTPGNVRQPGSARDIEERTGIPATTVLKADRHVETAENYPFMQTPDWKQYHVLEAREKLERLPESERPQAAELLGQPGIPPRLALETLGNLVQKSVTERQDIYALRQSRDSRDRSLALTKAADRPPMPDPRVLLLGDAIRSVERAAKAFPDDPLRPRFDDCLVLLREVQDDIRIQWRERQDTVSEGIASEANPGGAGG